ncbi:MAG TPA: ParB N-terminal domain-containing protein [Polyangia bacterium]|jgi:hypothetical protein
MTASEGDSIPISVEQLNLDRKNPRLSLDQRTANKAPNELLQIMLDEFALDELGHSFIENGFFRHEPLIVIEDKRGAKDKARSKDTYTVIEGNRRAAALKLLVKGPEAFGIKSQVFSDLHEAFISLPKNKQEALKSPTVAIVGGKIEVAGYIGFRHVTGIKQWAALEKAGYIVSLVEEDMSPDDIARVIGSKRAYVQRHYQAYRMIMQARDEELIDTTQVERQFGVFMRALQASGVRDFINVPPPQGERLEEKPIKPASRKPFVEFITWAFGTDKNEPLFTDSRRLTDFGRILRSPTALKYIRSMPNPDFEKAHYLSGGEEEEAATSAQTAEFALRDTVPYARQMKSNEAFSNSIKRCADYFSQILVYYKDLREEFFGKATGG